MNARAIVVGTDGAAPGHAAVRWAAAEARRRNLALRIVHVYDWEYREERFDDGDNCLDLVRRTADLAVAAAVEQAREVWPAVTIATETPMGRPAPWLVAAAADAELLVVGHRGRGGFTGLLLGSVSRTVAAHAPCPVVVVRGRDGASEGPVVAGVDGTPGPDLVLETAFDEASLRGAPLFVVHAYLPQIPLWLSASVPGGYVGTPEQDATEHGRIDALVAPWRAKYPDVVVETVLSHESPAAVLAGVSRRAQLVVVGSHGRGPIAGAMLGSTGAQLLHHADCPVYVARALS